MSDDVVDLVEHARTRQRANHLTAARGPDRSRPEIPPVALCKPTHKRFWKTPRNDHPTCATCHPPAIAFPGLEWVDRDGRPYLEIVQ